MNNCGSNKACCTSKNSKSECKTAVSPSEDELKNAVREHYKKIACDSSSGGCCSSKVGSCFEANPSEEYALQLGYTKEDLEELANGANIGLGCGNPLVMANLKPGECVLDLGSGAGFDAFLAAKAVGLYTICQNKIELCIKISLQNGLFFFVFQTPLCLTLKEISYYATYN